MSKLPISPNMFYVQWWLEWNVFAFLESKLNMDSKDLGLRNIWHVIDFEWGLYLSETCFHHLQNSNNNGLLANKWLWELCWAIWRCLVNDNNMLYKHYLLCTSHSVPKQYLLYMRYSINTCRIKLNFNPSRWNGKCLLKYNLENMLYILIVFFIDKQFPN